MKYINSSINSLFNNEYEYYTEKNYKKTIKIKIEMFLKKMCVLDSQKTLISASNIKIGLIFDFIKFIELFLDCTKWKMA